MKKKIILLLTVTLLNAVGAEAQMSYAGISIGYGAGWPAYSLGSSVTTSTSGTRTYTLEKGSFGQGLNFGITTGYMFDKNVGFELGLSYLIGDKQEFNTSTVDVDSTNHTVAFSDGTLTLDKIKMIRINPSVKISLGDQVRPYLRLGFVIGLDAGYSKIEQGTTIITGSASDTLATEIVTEYSGGGSLGFNSAFGLDVDLGDNLMLFGELSFCSMSWAPRKSEITRKIVNGIDLVPMAAPGSLETEYVDDYSQSANSVSGARALKTYLPFSTFGITAGVKFSFGE